MEANERKRARRRPADHAEPGAGRPAPAPEHDQDSEPPRTARAPGSERIDEEWGRQEGC